MEQIENQQQTATHTMTFRDVVDLAIILGCIPAVVLSVILWAVAVTFSGAKVLASIMALFITLLLTLIGIILIVRHVGIAVMNGRKYNTNFSEEALMASFGSGFVCTFLTICIIGCLSASGTLEGWHYLFIGAEILFVGYQTWRIFLGNRA